MCFFENKVLQRSYSSYGERIYAIKMKNWKPLFAMCLLHVNGKYHVHFEIIGRSKRAWVYGVIKYEIMSNWTFYSEYFVTEIATTGNAGNGTNTTEENSHSPVYTTWQAVLICFILGSVILLTIIGNCLVVLSVCLVRKLRTPANYLYVSLAVSDLSVAILVMPLALVNEISGSWSLGPATCDMWIAFDVMACTSSILNLCMISVDRYLAITRPLKYATKRTPKLMAAMITFIWMASALISLPPLFGWGNGNVHTNDKCLISQDYAYTVYSTFGAFYLPLIVMIVIYLKIYRAANLLRLADKKQNMLNNDRFRISSRRTTKSSSTDSGYENIASLHGTRDRKLSKRSGFGKSKQGNRISVSGERKAAKTLGVIMGAFILCWLPFFIVALLRPFCKCTISQVLNGCLLWLGYVNSLLNPIIYAMLNRDFRKPFQYLLTCRWKDLTKVSRNKSVKLALKLMAEERLEQNKSSHGNEKELTSHSNGDINDKSNFNRI
ncbi:5-hydroxytryptamine receptor 1F-like [Ptychodera flava]|uniref:5-hydroxytryptamine receptor 1F-like n=1 Tax=Ptychodera flava TaxID=63121 RepID=UPI003969E457